MDTIRIAVAGAAGRMGRTIMRSVLDDRECTLVAAIEYTGHPCVGSDAGLACGCDLVGMAITSDSTATLRNADALLDFTTPAVSVQFAQKAANARIVHVIGTTGFNQEQEGTIKAAAGRAVIIKSGNMSLGANLLAALVGQATRVLCDFDVQIMEMHHRKKTDAPSGTALMLGRVVDKARVSLSSESADAAEMSCSKDSIVGFVSLRGGTVVGEHKVIFAGAHERLVLEHVAEDRSIFARGAIAAAKWGRGRKPGLYEMLDVLGLR
jgi:4-hydroxy-tetrahydrodipicolinate reductase